LTISAVIIGLALSTPTPASLGISDNLAFFSLLGAVFFDSAIVSHTFTVVAEERSITLAVIGTVAATREESFFLFTFIGFVLFVEVFSILFEGFPFFFLSLFSSFSIFCSITFTSRRLILGWAPVVFAVHTNSGVGPFVGLARGLSRGAGAAFLA